MDITFTNFPTGSVSWFCVEEGTRYGPYSTTLTSSTETLSTNTCYDTESVAATTSLPMALSTPTRSEPTHRRRRRLNHRLRRVGGNPAPSGNWMDITFTNFPTGSVSWFCVEEGTRYGPYSTTLTSSTETLSTNTCYDTESGGSDYVSSDGRQLQHDRNRRIDAAAASTIDCGRVGR